MNPSTASAESPLPAGKEKRFQTISYYAAFVAQGLVGASLGPTLPALAANTQSSLSGISLLLTVRALGGLIGSFQGGKLYDRLTGHPVIAVSLLVMAVAMALIPLIPWLWLLAVLVLILGMATGVLNLGGNTLLFWVHRERIGPYMSGLHFFFGVGAFISPIIIAQALVMTGGIAWAYWIVAVLMLPVAFLLLRVPSPKAHTVSLHDSAGKVDYRLVVLVAVYFFIYLGAESSFGSWIFTYAIELKLGNPATAAYLTSAFWGALTLGRLLSIPLAARFRPRHILLADLAGCLLSVGTILLWPDSVTALWMGTLGVGLFMASIFPTSLSFVQRRIPVTGRITGWFMVAASAGSMFLPWLIGQLIGAIGPQVTMYAILIDLIMVLGILAVLASFWRRPVRHVYSEYDPAEQKSS